MDSATINSLTATTPKQEQILKALKGGKSAEDVAKDLKVTTNAIYQQIRRMRPGAAKAAKKSGPRKRGTSPKVAATAKAPAAAPVTQTPLQALGARKSELESTLKGADADVAAAEKVLANAKELRTKINDKVGGELRQVEGAMAVLRGEANASSKPKAAAKKPAAPKAPAKPAASNGNGAEKPVQAPQTPTATVPAPATPAIPPKVGSGG